MKMRYELNFDEDKVNDVLVVGGASYDLKGCCELLNEQQATIQSLKEENEQLRKELGDCEKFRYQVFKRMNDEYIKECSMK